MSQNRSGTSTTAIPILRRSIALKNIAAAGRTRKDAALIIIFFGLTELFREDHSILIAGCGTSQAAKHALRWPGAQVTAIDISATSVRCTEDLKRKYNLSNLQVYQLPIERVNELETTFDQIVCTGVLHHLADPDAGTRSLCATC